LGIPNKKCRSCSGFFRAAAKFSSPFRSPPSARATTCFVATVCPTLDEANATLNKHTIATTPQRRFISLMFMEFDLDKSNGVRNLWLLLL
jgi:hypothetical protein